jgi:TM2 domain-containing membrane protein YozV
MTDTLPRVFRSATWYRIFSAFAMLAISGAGSFYIMNGTAAWQRIGGAALIAFGVAGFLDVLVSRIVLDQDAISVISLVRKRSYPRADFESAKVDGGAVCLKRHDGGWLVLPSTGANALSVRNTIHAWVKANSK